MKRFGISPARGLPVRVGKKADALTLAVEASATMKPRPEDEQNPMAGGANPDNLILWLAYKEAKTLIGFDAPPLTRSSPMANDRIARMRFAPRVGSSSPAHEETS